MPLPDWQRHYGELFDRLQAAFDFDCDLTVEFVTHRFTPGSKEVLLGWYPNTSLDLDESTRAVKRNKFGGLKYVYDLPTMKELKAWFYSEWQRRFPNAPVQYWT
jgi:spore photoproduct lyase